MNPGKLRHKITIQYNAAAGQTDANGIPLEDWQELITTKANRTGLPLKGRLFYEASAVQAEGFVQFTIRYYPGVTAGMKLIHGADTFEIKTPPSDLDGRRLFLQILARQVLQNGG
jgi:SPP1 family predicted phage head-tail adaptor